MGQPKQTSTTKRLTLGFCSLIAIFLIFGLLALYDIDKTSRLTQTIYNHPLVVSNAALQVNASIAKMHRNMKDVVLFRSPDRIQRAIDAVDEEERLATGNLDIIQHRILGDEGKALAREARRLFEAWRPIRREVIRLVRDGQPEIAAEITIGRGAAQVVRLEEKMLGLTQYARQKATQFIAEADRVNTRQVATLIGFLLLGILASAMVAVYSIRSSISAERLLSKSESRYRSLIEAQTDLVCRFTPDGRFIFVNDVYCQFFDQPKETLIGHQWQPLPVDDDLHVIEAKLATLSPDTPTVTIENRVFSGDGQIHWMQFVNKGLFDNRGQLTEIQSVGRDITDAKKALEEINRQNALLGAINTVLKEAPGCPSLQDIGKLCLRVAEQVTGSRFGSIAEVNENGRFNTLALSNPGWDQCRAMDGDHDVRVQDMEIRGIWKAALDSKNGIIIDDPGQHPLSVGTPDGHPPLIRFMGFPFQHNQMQYVLGLANKESAYTIDDLATIASLTGTFIEVIEHKRAEEALAVGEANYRVLFQSGSDAILLVDTTSMCLLDGNQAALQMYGYSRDELVQLKATDLSAEAAKTRKVLQEAQSTVIPIRYHRKKDGTVFPVEITASYFDQNGRHINISSVRDISERLDAETEKKRLESQLRQAQKMESIGTLAGGIAHDFNNILASILGFTELSLEDAEQGSILEDNLQEIFTAGRRAKDLVKQILAFARQSEENQRPVRVDIIAKEVLKLLRSSIPASVSITQEINSKAHILGNPSQIHQILINLCTNAAQSMEPDGGTLAVILSDGPEDDLLSLSRMGLQPGHFLKLVVSDTGVGISPEIVDRIFDPYFTTKAPGEGTGMGLAMIHGIIKTYGGGIAVESTVGLGSVFTAYFPTTEADAAEENDSPISLPTGVERILIVDDERPIARMGKRILERLGYAVTTESKSTDALEMFRAQSTDFDLVITDMAMPDLSGDKLAIEMMAIRPDIPIIMFTGYSRQMSEKIARDIGIKSLAYKPLVKMELAEAVRRVLDEAKN